MWVLGRRWGRSWSFSTAAAAVVLLDEVDEDEDADESARGIELEGMMDQLEGER